METTGFTLENFKAIAKHRFRVTKLNLFLGKNGMGKSSTLQALLGLRQSLDLFSPEKLFTPSPEQNSSEKNFNLHLKGKYVNLGFSNHVLTTYTLEQEIRFGFETPSGLVKLTMPVTADRDMLKVKLELPDQYPSGDYLLEIFANQFQYLSADRIPPNDLYESGNRSEVEEGEIGSTGQNTALFLLIHGNNEIPEPMRLSTASTNQLLDQVSAYMSALGNSMRVRVGPIADRVSLNYEVLRADGIMSDTIKPQNTGFGLTYSLPVITTLLSGSAGKIQIIENPESHLHPKGQAIVGTLLAKAAKCGQKLFVETHSDHVVNGIRVAVKNGLLAPKDVALHFFGQDSKGLDITEIGIDKNGELSDYPDGFLDEWQTQLINLI